MFERRVPAPVDDFRDPHGRLRRPADFPNPFQVRGYLIVHLRHGTVSIRALARTPPPTPQRHGNRGAETWLSELTGATLFFRAAPFSPYRWHAGRPQKASGGIRLVSSGKRVRSPMPISPRGAKATGLSVSRAAIPDNQSGYMLPLRMVRGEFFLQGAWGLTVGAGANISRRCGTTSSCHRIMAVGVGVFRGLRRTAVFPHFQSGHAVVEIRYPRQVQPSVRVPELAAFIG